MVTVEKGVQLEVLDWGGKGRPVVLLAGLGNTAHIYDNFAPKLARYYHVYGITRRGFGASSAPATGYSVDRLGEDVIAVLDALKIVRPVLVGHSRAGEEVSWVATRYPDRIAGAVYLDAAYGYGFYDPSVGDLAFDLPELQKDLAKFSASQQDVSLMDKLLNTDLPLFERDLRKQRAHIELVKKVPGGLGHPAASDMASFKALGAWYAQNLLGGPPPEAELHQSFESNPDGSVGKPRPHPAVRAIEGQKWEKFTNIRVPVLAIFACPVDYGPLIDKDPALRKEFDAYNTADCRARAQALQKDVPSARALLWPHAHHYLFIAEPNETLRALRSFIDSLPQ